MIAYAGLKEKDVQSRLVLFGPNILRELGKKSIFIRFLEQFKDLNVLILIGAAVVSMMVAYFHDSGEELIDAYVILGIVILNACIGFTQEFKAERALEALKSMISPMALVVRDGKEQQIDAKDLVPGDILILAEGSKIPADAILLLANELKVEESALTGESVPVYKTAVEGAKEVCDALMGLLSKDFPEELHAIEKPHRLFMGTSVVAGSGKAVVLHTGMQTEFGEIAELTMTTEKDTSPLQKELFGIGIFVGKITVVISVLLFCIGYFVQGYSLVFSLLFAVAVAVAAVPEGLPATITIALAMGVQRLATKNAIVKQLASVETLGSTTVICSDKTGTLTQNEMTVKEMYLASGYDVFFDGVGYEPKGGVSFCPSGEDEKVNGKHLSKVQEFVYGDVVKFCHIVSYCNDAKLDQEGKKWRVLGDPTEGALLTMAQKMGIEDGAYDRIKDFPFDSFRKRMSVIVRSQSNKSGGYELFVKGAPDSILDMSTHVFRNGKIEKLTAAEKKKIMLRNNNMAENALRVLAVGFRPIDKPKDLDKQKKEGLEKEFVFVGLVGMIDPPRKGVKESVSMCHQAGIRTIVITGDYGKTALAIAENLGIASSRKCRVITGTELSKMTDKKLKDELNKHYEVIFARVEPNHKMRVVDALKALGEVVAVTGDGVNDAPALKRADIGIAMGSGTDVAKEAANMILTDDSFATIVRAIREGRMIYKNLRKFVWYIFSCNVGELVTIFTAILLAIPAPLTAILILCVDLGTDVLPALALGVDPEEPGIMSEKPRNPKERIMNRGFIMYFLYLGLIIGFIVLGVYLWELYSMGWHWGQILEPRSDMQMRASTLAFATLVLIQMFNAFNARSSEYSNFKLRVNYYLWGAVIISVLTVFAFVHVPFIQEMIQTTHLSWGDWLVVLCASSSIFFIEEIRKAFFVVHKKVREKVKVFLNK